MKLKTIILIAIVSIVRIHSTLAQVTNLGIAQAGNQSVLYWPNTNANFILQSTTNLTAPQWVTADDAVPVAAITVTNGLPQRFFRLLYTNPPAGMVLIPGGLFTIGDTLDGENDAIPTNVYVSAFYMDTNLVSYGLWANIYTYATNNGYGFSHAGAGKGYMTNQPVQSSDWYDSVKWCNARSAQAGLTPVYYTDAGLTQVYTNLESYTVYANWSADGFRLPTEAEWEKAARGGLIGRRFPWGTRIDENQANYYGTNTYSYDLGPNGYNAVGNYPTTSPGTSPVGSFDMNGYGLYDMAGNLYEICWDWYAGPPYPTGSPYKGGSNPRGPSTGTSRVARGGSWMSQVYGERCAYRTSASPINAAVNGGLRCVRGL